MAIQSSFYLPTKPVASGKTYYCVLRNATSISEPLRSSIGGSSAGGMWNFSTQVFDAGASVDCSNASIWANYTSVMSEENAGQCGGIYLFNLPTKLQSAGMNLEILVYEQVGGSPAHGADEFQTIATHYTGDQDYSVTLSISPSDDEDIARLVAVFTQDSRLKDASGTPVFDIEGPAVLTGAAVRIGEGTYYQAINLSGLTTGAYVSASVEAPMQSGTWHSGVWNDTGVDAVDVEDVVYFAKGADIGSAVNAIGNRPVITGT